MIFIDEYYDYSILIIHDFFSNKQIKEILDESNYINTYVGLESPTQTGAALYEDGQPSKSGGGVFLDRIVTNRGRYMSRILRILDLFLSDEKIINEYIDINPANSIILNTNSHDTLMNYYEDNDFYDFHRDLNVYSIIHLFSEQPQSFSGGDIIFSINDKEITIPFRNNCSIIFPAAYQHKVTSIKMNKNILSDNRMMGRFSFVQLLNIYHG